MYLVFTIDNRKYTSPPGRRIFVRRFEARELECMLVEMDRFVNVKMRIVLTFQKVFLDKHG